MARDMTSALLHSENSLLETQRLAQMGSFQLNQTHVVSACTGNLHALFGLHPEKQIEHFRTSF